MKNIWQFETVNCTVNTTSTLWVAFVVRGIKLNLKELYCYYFLTFYFTKHTTVFHSRTLKFVYFGELYPNPFLGLRYLLFRTHISFYRITLCQCLLMLYWSTLYLSTMSFWRFVYHPPSSKELDLQYLGFCYIAEIYTANLV